MATQNPDSHKTDTLFVTRVRKRKRLGRNHFSDRPLKGVETEGNHSESEPVKRKQRQDESAKGKFSGPSCAAHDASINFIVPLPLSGHTHTVRRLGNVRSSSTDKEKEKGREDAGPATSTSTGYRKVQENRRRVAEELQKAWKLQQEKDDLITFKDAGLDMYKRALPSGDG